MPQRGIYSVTVPGVVAGLGRDAQRFGTKPFSELLAPAIYYAENGFPLSETIAAGWADSVKMHSEHPNSQKTYLIDGDARAEGGRGLPQPRPCRLAAPHRREGPRRLLQGQDRRGHPRDLARAGRHVDRRRPRGVPARVGHADQDDLPRLERLRDRPEHAGHRRADDAEPDGAVSDGGVRLPQHQRAARDDRSEEARLRRHAALRRRSEVLARSRSTRC